MTSLLYVGADIAALTIDLHWQHIETGETNTRTIPQKAAAYQQVITRLAQLAPACQTHVVMEATGTYWLRFALALHTAGIRVSVINPQRAYFFAKSRLQRAKSDAIDARLLCDFARLDTPDLWTPPPPVYHALQQHLQLRQQLVDSRTQYRNRLHALQQNPDLLDSIGAHYKALIADFTTQIDQLTATIADLLSADHAWQAAAQRLQTISGIGTLCAAWILVATHAFERCATPEQAAAFAGLVPHINASGSSHRHRTTGGGHARLRTILYMAAGSAIQHNPPIRDFYNGLVKRGKIKKVARVAAARKLLHIAWACVTKQRDFDPHFGQSTAAA